MDNDDRIDPNEESEENSELTNFKFNSGFLQLKTATITKTSSQNFIHDDDDDDDVYENGCSKDGVVEIMHENGMRQVLSNDAHDDCEDVYEVEYEYDENEDHSQFQSEINDFHQLNNQIDHAQSKESTDNLNDSTSKYLNMLGEDLLMEVQDIASPEHRTHNNTKNDVKIRKKKSKTHGKRPVSYIKVYKNSSTNNANQSMNHDANVPNNEYYHEIEDFQKPNGDPEYQNHYKNDKNEFLKTFISNPESGDVDENQLESMNKFNLSKSDLINLIEQLNRSVEFERFEKLKIKEKYNNCILENKKCLNLLEQYNVEREEIVKEYNTLKNAKIKDNKRFNLEIEAISREYSQVMSERDSVHKEMEALQEQLSKAQERIKKYQRDSTIYSSANNILNMSNFGANLSANNDTLNELINNVNFNNSAMNNGVNNSSLSNRQQKCNSVIYDRNNLGSMEQSLELDALKQQISLVTRQRDEAVNQIRELHHQLGSVSDDKFNDLEYVDRYLTENTNSNIKPDEENEMLKYELKELLKELESSKKRRDMAFNERDKMLKERESIRALCDDMRHQRDKAISELAEALHESDELKKAKSMAYRQIQILEDNQAMLEEKVAYLKELHEMKEEEKRQQMESAKNLQKSIEEDYTNWKTLRIDIDMADNIDLGINLAYASNIVTRLQTEENNDSDAEENNNCDTETENNTNFIEENYPICKNPNPHGTEHAAESSKNFTQVSELSNFNDVNSNGASHNNSHGFSYDNSCLTDEPVMIGNDQIEDTSFNETENEEKELNDIQKIYDENQQDQETNHSNDEPITEKDDHLERLILISQIDENGLAFGKLKLYDRLLKINDINVEQLNINEIKQIIYNLDGNTSFIISRHFSKSHDSLNRSSNARNSYQIVEEGAEESDANDDMLSTSMSLSTSITNSKEENSELYKVFNDRGFDMYQHDQKHDKQQNNKEMSQAASNSKLKESTLRKIIGGSSKRNISSFNRNLSDKNNFDLVSIKKSSLGDLLLETGVYISATKERAETVSKAQADSNKNVLSIGDRILSINGISLTNKNLYEVMDLVDQCRNFNLVIQKITPNCGVSNGQMVNSSSSIFNYLKNQSHPHKEYFMVSQTLSNASSSTSNNKINRRAQQKHPNNNQSKAMNRRSMQHYQTDSQSSLSQIHLKSNTKHPTPGPVRPHYNINKQFRTRNKSFDSKNETPKSGNELTDSQIDSSKHEIQDPNYQELVRNFHTQNRKEHQIMNIEKSSHSSLSNHKHTSSRDLTNADKPKRIIISDLMQYTQNRNFNPIAKKVDVKLANNETEKFENGEESGATKKTAKYCNTAL